MTPGAPRADAQISYSASSPDDSAVVQGAARVGFTFLDRRAGRARTRLRGVVTDFRILRTMPFSSLSKRHSVIVRQVVPRAALLIHAAQRN